MRFVLIDYDYPEFLEWLYGQTPRLTEQPYEEQSRVRAESLFGVADFYSSNLRKLGHEAWDLHPNNEIIQEAWRAGAGGSSNGIGSRSTSQHLSVLVLQLLAKSARGPLEALKPIARPLVRPLRRQGESRLNDILRDQIQHYDPDVVINYHMAGIASSALRDMLPPGRALLGQIASPIPQNGDFGGYDLVLSSLPSFVDYFKDLGLRAELQRLAFEPRVLRRLNGVKKSIPVSFVGSVSRDHTSRSELLEYLCQLPELEVWGRLAGDPGNGSAIRRRHKGAAWGVTMYQVLAASKITINHHIDIAGSHANNLRLYEATGVGTMLLTDWKEDLHEIFEPGKEVVTYRSPEECLELVRYYLEHDDEREAIARAGQARTLSEHTFENRMKELMSIVDGLS